MDNNTPDFKEFHVNSATYQTLLTKKFVNRKVWQKADPNEIRSFIPGSIVEILVQTGQHVKKGETLLTVDAMKMYSKVKMPFDGLIKEIHVAKGNKVPKNALMITIE
jgi:biotin carboxyl carrier protein